MEHPFDEGEVTGSNPSTHSWRTGPEQPGPIFPFDRLGGRKPMPNDFLSINLLLCERVLTEADGVLSAIRIVDVF